MRSYLFIVEGNQDIALLTRVLSLIGLRPVERNSELSQLMSNFLPKKYPFVRDELSVFNIVPVFCKSEHVEIAIINANGEKNIIPKLDNLLSTVETAEIQELNKIIVFADGDTVDRDKKINEILDIDFEELEITELQKEELISNPPKLTMGGRTNMDLDFYIFPNNDTKGRIEDIILEGINIKHQDILEPTKEFLANLPNKYINKWSEKNSREEKALIGIVGNVLMPGCANTVYIYDKNNRFKWISPETIQQSESMKKLYDYLCEIVE